MALYYLDTSALVKLYVHEAGTDRMRRLVTFNPADKFVILSLAQVELQSAVRRRERAGDFPKAIADRLLGIFQDHLAGVFQQQRIGDVEIQSACSLIDRFGLKTMDAIHLAAFLTLSMKAGTEATLESADEELLRAAEAQRLRALDVSADKYDG